MKLEQALKKSSVVRRASKKDDVYFENSGELWNADGQSVSLPLEAAFATDWQFKIVTEKWLGGSEKTAADGEQRE